MTTCSLGAGVGVDGEETAAACLLVLTLDMSFYRGFLTRCRVSTYADSSKLDDIKSFLSLVVGIESRC